jgi:hypothetical protein
MVIVQDLSIPIVLVLIDILEDIIDQSEDDLYHLENQDMQNGDLRVSLINYI